jgi:hypothetical protein
VKAEAKYTSNMCSHLKDCHLSVWKQLVPILTASEMSPQHVHWDELEKLCREAVRQSREEAARRVMEGFITRSRGEQEERRRNFLSILMFIMNFIPFRNLSSPYYNAMIRTCVLADVKKLCIIGADFTQARTPDAVVGSS